MDHGRAVWPSPRTVQPCTATADGTLVTSSYDWSEIDEEWKKREVFPMVSESALKVALGILERTVRR